MISAKKACYSAAQIGFKPDPKLTIDEWADLYRIMPKAAGYNEPGRYRTSRTPYMKEIMRSLSPSSPVRQVKFMKGSQLGGTEAANNWIAYIIHLNPGPILYVLPTVEAAQKFSKKKLNPSLQATTIISGRIKKNRSRDSGNTILLKEFPGGSLTMAGSNSAASFRSDSIRDLILDEVDSYPLDVDGEGDPCDLAINRTDTYPNRKIFKISTPTLKGVSRIEAEYEDSDQRKYFVPCPHCNQKQVLEWGGKGADFGIKFEHEGVKVTRAWYECKFCHRPIDEHHKTWMLENGEWISQNPGHPDAGFHLSSLYSPIGWKSWADLSSEFLKIKKNVSRLKRFMNTRLGLPFEEEGSQPDWEALKARSEPYKILDVPRGGMLLSAGVDVQDNRLSVLISAWGREEECWIIYWGELFGDPAQPDVWKELDRLISMSFKHASGVELNLVSVAIDSGGHHTQAVYNYCRARSPRVVAVKGLSVHGKPIIGRPTLQDVTYRGASIKHGVQLWPVGTDTCKGVIYGRLKQAEPGPGFIHFPIGLSDDFFSQLTAEKQVTRLINGYPSLRWVKVNERNEALDCFVYALAAAYRAGLPRINWDELEAMLTGKNKEEQRPQRPQTAQSKWMSEHM